MDKETITPKQKLSQAGKDFTKAGKNAILTTLNTGKGIYNLADAGDKTLSKIIPDNKLEGSKIKEGIKNTINFTKNNIIKLFLAGSIVGYSGHKIADAMQGLNEGNKNKIELTDNNLEKKITTKSEFIKYLQNTDLGPINREQELGRYLRVLRYDKEIKKYSEKDSIGYENLFGLTMVESQGNPASINEHDGGAGFLHTQPDVYKRFTRDFMGKEGKVFTDNEIYKKYSFQNLKKKGLSKSQIYKKHGEELEKFIRLRGMQELENVDDRFNYDKILKFASAYLSYIKTRFVEPGYELATQDKSRDKYKNDKEFDLINMFMLNGFNKGPGNFKKDFKGNKDALAGMHMVNIKNNIRAMRHFEDKLKQLLSQGLSGNDIINKLGNYYIKTGKIDQQGFDIFKYDGFSKSPTNIAIDFNKKDTKNGNYFINTGSANIIDSIGNKIKLNKNGEIANGIIIYIKAKTIFEKQDYKDSQKQLIFKSEVKDFDNPKSIVQKFNERNTENGSKYINIDINKITNIDGNTLKKIKSKEKYVYIHTNIAKKQ